MEGDEHNWLELDADSGELKTKAALDRETVEQITLTVIAYETGETNTPERAQMHHVSPGQWHLVNITIYFGSFQRETSRRVRWR